MPEQEVGGEREGFLRVSAPFGEAGVQLVNAPTCAEECGQVRCTHPHLPTKTYTSDEMGFFRFTLAERALANEWGRIFRQRETSQEVVQRRISDAERRAREASNLDDLVQSLKSQHAGQEDLVAKVAAAVGDSVIRALVAAQSTPSAPGAAASAPEEQPHGGLVEPPVVPAVPRRSHHAQHPRTEGTE